MNGQLALLLILGAFIAGSIFGTLIIALIIHRVKQNDDHYGTKIPDYGDIYAPGKNRFKD